MVEKVEVVTGLFVSPGLSSWLGAADHFSYRVTADKPIAVGHFDDHLDSGYYFGAAGQTTLYDEYLHVHYTQYGFPGLRHDLYLSEATSITYHDVDGVQVGSTNYSGETATVVDHDTVGYDSPAAQYLVHSVASKPFANDAHYVTPAATDIRDRAAYMGWNAGLAILEIVADAGATIEVYDGRNQQVVTSFDVGAGEVFSANLDTLGFAPDEPFLASVVANVPVYQQIRIPQFYLRQYPAALGPEIPQE